MHKKNMVSEAIDFRFLLMENYKKLKINEKELVTLFMIDHFITLGKSIRHRRPAFFKNVPRC